MKKKIASELCDKEKLADSFLVVGESYQNLRNFHKARKWYNKSWEIYEVIGNLEVRLIFFLACFSYSSFAQNKNCLTMYKTISQKSAPT